MIIIVSKPKEFIEEFNKNVIDDKFLNECREASRLFKKTEDAHNDIDPWIKLDKIKNKIIEEQRRENEHMTRLEFWIWILIPNVIGIIIELIKRVFM